MSLFAVQWYEYAGQAARWRQFWQQLSGFVPARAPIRFWTQDPEPLWRSGEYDLTWACGGDVALHPGRFCPIAVPIFAASPLAPGQYCSLIVRRHGACDLPFAQLQVGLNAAASVSGHLALARWWHAAGHPDPARVLVTGGHEASVRALLDGRVDLAALDSQGFDLLGEAYEGLVTHCQIIAQTPPLPAPPLCLPAGIDPRQESAWREGLRAASAALATGDLHDCGLGICGFHPVTEADYKGLGDDLRRQLASGRTLVTGACTA